MGNVYGIRLSAEQTVALRALRARFGRRWKTELRGAWATGDYASIGVGDFSCELQQLRHTGGPSWLGRFASASLEAVS